MTAVRNGHIFCDSSDVPPIITNKYSASVILFAAVASEDKVIPTPFSAM